MERSHKINELNTKLVGKKVILSGWVDTIREHGSVVFIDLRDRYGKVQTVIHKKKSGFEEAKGLSVESCIQIEGEVKSRPKGSENLELGDMGKVEISIDKLKSSRDEVNNSLRELSLTFKATCSDGIIDYSGIIPL